MPIWLRYILRRIRYRVVCEGEVYFCEQGPEAVHWLSRPSAGEWLRLTDEGVFNNYKSSYVTTFQTRDAALDALYRAIGQFEYRRPRIEVEFEP